MVRTKKARLRNRKAREQVVTHEDQKVEKIDVKIKGLKDEDYDDSNKLVLPSKKKKNKIKVHDVPKARKLSKKQRKKLEKIVEVRDKKQKRAGLLEALQTVQATEAEMKLLTSTKEIHNRKLKRHLEIEETPSGIVKINAISGSKKKQKRQETIVVSDESESTGSSSSDSDMESENETDITKDCETETKDQKQDASTSKPDDKVSNKKQDTKTDSIDKSSEVKPKDSKTPSLKRTVHIPINRTTTIQEERLKLPILGEEQVIMEVINDNPVVILCGETGSGKTTQVPQFLYEAGYAHDGGIIGITEPRRVAAISMSKRVAEEMNLTTSEVSYQIRYEGNVTKDTKVKFMTDGVLLKEIQKDFLLSKYNVIIIDEAHERSVYTDILIGLLSRIVPLRQKKGVSLKLIIMSATLRVEDFTENSRLFKVTPPVIKIDARQYPVAVHFNKRTPVEDYLGEAFKKVCKIHRQLPDGGILVFVTGQQEVHTLCTKLRNQFPFKNPTVTDGKDAKTKRKKTDDMDEEKPKLPEISLDDFSVLPLDEEAEMAAVQNQSDAELSDDMGLEDGEEIGDSKHFRPIENEQALHVLPLFSLLASDRQARVFQAPPDGSRLCIVTTNVAETSLTIPNVKYVVDTGKVKTKFYDKVTGVSTFHVTWTSKASANQRAGRAGRTSPGHCYRLYSSAVFNDEFEKFSPPEITRRPVEDLVLQMKDINIDKVVNFPFPTPPSVESLKAAENLLISLGALEKPPTPRQDHRKKAIKEVIAAKITPLGRAMACFPVSPRYGKMLSLGHQHDLLPYVVVIVSALSVQEIFIEIHNQRATDEDKEDLSLKKQRIKQVRKTWAGQGHSLLLGDLMVLLKAVGACVYAGGGVAFCERHGIRYKAMLEVNKLRVQLTNAVNAVIPEADLAIDPKMKPPSDLQAKLLRQIVLTGLGDHVARKMPEPPPGSDDAKKLKHAYQSLILDDPVFIHPSSVLYREKVDYLVFQHIEETSKLYMKGLCVIEPEWLPVFVPSQCTFSKPLEDPPPNYDGESGNIVCHMTSNFGSHFWQLGAVQVEHPPDLDRYKWFARFLLEGKVFQKLSKFVPSLLSTPTTMIKAWAKLQPRTEVLLSALVKEGVDCRQKLTESWKQQPDYLLNAYLTWIPEVQHDEVKAMWPPVDLHRPYNLH